MIDIPHLCKDHPPNNYLRTFHHNLECSFKLQENEEGAHINTKHGVPGNLLRPLCSDFRARVPWIKVLVDIASPV